MSVFSFFSRFHVLWCSFHRVGWIEQRLWMILRSMTCPVGSHNCSVLLCRLLKTSLTAPCFAYGSSLHLKYIDHLIRFTQCLSRYIRTCDRFLMFPATPGGQTPLQDEHIGYGFDPTNDLSNEVCHISKVSDPIFDI